MGKLIMHILLVVLSILNARVNDLKVFKILWSICAVLWGVLTIGDMVSLIAG